MKTLTCRIEIGDFIFDSVNSVDIQSSMENLTDTCKIVLPRKVTWKKKEVKLGGGNFFKRGDTVKVKLGYDSNLNTHFQGYVRKVHSGSPVMIECEDAMCLLREVIIDPININLFNPGLFSLLTQLPSRGMLIKAAPIMLGKFRSSKTTFSALLNRLREEYGLYSYIRDGVLFCGPAFWGALKGKHRFIYDYNIISDSLQFQNAKDINLRLDVKTITEDNKTLHFSLGDKKGELVKLNAKEIGYQEIAKLAKEILLDKKYDGYTGFFKTFGEPFVRHGDIVKIEDKKFPEREGDYLVRAVDYSFNKDGFRQIIYLGRRADFKLLLAAPNLLKNMALAEVSKLLLDQGIRLIKKK